jgi:hypothetical protein
MGKARFGQLPIVWANTHQYFGHLSTDEKPCAFKKRQGFEMV